MSKRNTAHLCSEKLTKANSFVEFVHLGEGAVRANVRLKNAQNTIVTTQSFWNESVEASIKAGQAFYSTFIQ